MDIKKLNEKLGKFLNETKVYFVCLDGEPVSPDFDTEKEAVQWAELTYDIDDDRVSIESDEAFDESYQKNKVLESAQKNEANGVTLLRDMKDFKKMLDTQYKDHPGYYQERKDAINIVIDLLEELYI